ncbi:hypothetical protein BDV41DRAFT_111061 [Aspergillus transmontanensis]|uniref:Major facilitator superfamily domain-containing protein n=1 Tax=Aspergillus transmontanensis TaxID=1034304 RepID=A0A5N6W6M3_9EURO|nr:hypothetical protein BDV41DRAFT_111061 [Aspergillus transmontanensis]
MDPRQPLSIRFMYGSALAVQGFDAFAFIMTSSIVIPKQLELAHPLTRFWMRVTGVSFLPFVLNCWLLRKHHIRHSRVGFIVGSCFFLHNAGLAALYIWSAIEAGEYTIQPLWYAAGWRGVWATWSMWGLLAA